MGSASIGQRMAIEVVADSTDIGATSITSKYLDMANYSAVTFVVTLGTTLEGTPDGWHASDTLDDFLILAATDSSGTNAETIVTGTTAATGTAGDTYTVSCDATALGYNTTTPTIKNTHVACKCAEDDDSGADYVTIVGIRYHSRYQHDDLSSTYQKVDG